MHVRFAADGEISEWNSHIVANPDHGNLFQGDEFAEQKKLGHWKPRYLFADNTAITVLEKHVLGLGNMWYIPKGPGVDSVALLGEALPEIAKLAQKNKAFVLKIEPEIEKTEDNLKSFASLGLLPVAPIQPHNSTVLIDLRPDLDDILAGFNQKGRHALKRAERDGVIVKRVETSDENCQLFYKMFAETAGAHGFVIRPYDYQFKFWRRYADSGLGQMFFTYHEDTLIGCAFAMVFAEKSLYKDAASVKDKSVYGANHLMQWHIIQWAREQGSKFHDLGGSPPSDRILDETHPHYGIGRFKTSFNKHVTDYVGAFDLPIRGLQYGVWTKFGERLTKRRWWRKHHESWY